VGVVLASLASPDTPAAAGSAAALCGAAAAAVVRKAANVSNRKGEAAQAATLAARLVALALRDARVHGEARAALATVESPGDERRDFRLGEVLRRSSAVPLEIAEACADVVTLAAGEAHEAAPDLRPDAVAAAALAAGAARAAAHIVAVNLTVHEGDPYLARARGAASSAADVVAGLGGI